ncbi:MAG: DUF4197 domain-containing protein [Hyphomicrobiales bacterium]
MKKLTGAIALILILSMGFTTCKKDETNPDNTDKVSYVDALLDLLNVAIDNSVKYASKVDGYFKNDDIKILLPKEIQTISELPIVKDVVKTFVEPLIKQLNRTAETAAQKALPIFKDAIKKLNFEDALAIVNGADNAATDYLKKTTYNKLYDAFHPDIVKALEESGAQQTWGLFAEAYNNIPLVPEIGTDLAKYTTEKALDGLFILMEQEEAKVRKNADAQVTDLLRKVFGNN